MVAESVRRHRWKRNRATIINLHRCNTRSTLSSVMLVAGTAEKRRVRGNAEVVGCIVGMCFGAVCRGEAERN